MKDTLLTGVAGYVASDGASQLTAVTDDINTYVQIIIGILTGISLLVQMIRKPKV